MKNLIVFGLLALIMWGSGCTELEKQANPPTHYPTDLSKALDQLIKKDETTITPNASPIPLKPVKTQVTLGAIGDILLHNRVYEDAAKPDGSYDFTKMFKNVNTLLHQPEIVVANQESMTGGKELGLSSYPMFNSPHEIGDALKASGVNFITMANNHTMDKKEQGILSALAYWDKIEMAHTGAFKSQADRDKIRTMTKNDITFAFLAYTYGTNGIPVPEDKPYLVNLNQEDLMRKDIEAAKSKGDVIVVSMHWGIEDQTIPNAEQLRLANLLSEMGADIIIGTHPHVLQPFAWIQRADGHKTFVMYSLGNFLSAQVELLQWVGGLGEITIVKTVIGDKSSIELINPAFIPTFTYSQKYHDYQIIPMAELDDQHLDKAAQQLNLIKLHMRKYIPELQYP
jgi:poly-gamma-glutamate capsule biosynthesis protein CapA/YwtB (metallophosphatase superfamily)